MITSHSQNENRIQSRQTNDPNTLHQCFNNSIYTNEKVCPLLTIRILFRVIYLLYLSLTG